LKGEGAWYARSGGKLQELYTIMHLPYTSMVLSYVLVGAAVSPFFYSNRVIATLIAYFLGLGLSAHALNELRARHWGEALSKRELEVLFAAPLIGAILIGALGMVVLYATSGALLPPLVLLAFIILENFFLFAYNTDFSGGRFHTDLSFAFSWAALPVLVSYYVNALTITVVALLVAMAMSATAGIEINLSRWCKDFRRRSPLTQMQLADGTKLSLNTAELIARPEKSLKLIVVAVDLLAIGLTIYKLLP
jgi:hypothetical protein